MSQRISGYTRLERDTYFTPPWCVMALRPHMQNVKSIWEPAAGNLSMAHALNCWQGVTVRATDISTGTDFLKTKHEPYADAIVTNPPYNQAQAFIEHALEITKVTRGRVAMLLRVDFDSAKTRQHLFGRCRVFAKKIVLTERIRWFPNTKGSPSFNHAWYIWDHRYDALDGARIVYHERELPK